MTTFALRNYRGHTVVKEYAWRDRHGNFHRIEDMETRHLFHVVRMIWDHSMPKEWQTTFRSRYHFPEFYDVDYMALSVRLMFPALMNRKDLTPEMWFWIGFMEACLLEKRIQVPFVRKIGYEKA